MRTTRKRAASAGGNPTVRQRELGIRLRELRNAVSLTVEQVGEQHSPQRPVVYVEGLFTNRYLERPDEISRYREAMEYLRDAALSPRDSLGLITKIRDNYQS